MGIREWFFNGKQGENSRHKKAHHAGELQTGFYDIAKIELSCGLAVFR